MIRPRPAVALLALALSVPAASVHAQTGAGVVAGIRSVSGASGAQGDGTQDGIELRGLLERPIRAGGSTTPSWRIELAYTQLQKPREDALVRSPSHGTRPFESKCESTPHAARYESTGPARRYACASATRTGTRSDAPNSNPFSLTE